MNEKAKREMAIGRAVRKERERCATIAESFMTARGRSESEGGFVARRIADVIRGGPVRPVSTGTAGQREVKR